MSISEDLPKDIFEPKSKKKENTLDTSFFFKPGDVKVKMFLEDDELKEMEPMVPADPTTIDCSDEGRSSIPDEVLIHVIEQTENFENMVRHVEQEAKGLRIESVYQAKCEFLGTAPSLIRSLAARVRYLQKKGE